MMAEYLTYTRGIAFTAGGPGGKEFEFFGHWLIEMNFQYTISSLGGSRRAAISQPPRTYPRGVGRMIIIGPSTSSVRPCALAKAAATVAGRAPSGQPTGS